MPELPEVETVARGLNKIITGERVKDVEVLRQDSIAYPLKKAEFERLLKGHVFQRAWRRGKYIVIELSEGARLVVHLRMSGRLVVRHLGACRAGSRASQPWRSQPGNPKSQRLSRSSAGVPASSMRSSRDSQPNFLRVRILLESGRELHFEDMRVFGRLWYVPAGSKLEKVVSGLGQLGVEPLSELTSDYLFEALKGKRQPIKSALLDQRIIAGIGNIYADEALFLSGINPQCPAGDLSLSQVERLIANINSVLCRAIELGGSTLRDYQDIEGVNGNYQDTAKVYGRKGESCRNCLRGKIERVKLAGRSSYYCPNCQPLNGKPVLKRSGSAVRRRSIVKKPGAKKKAMIGKKLK